MSEITLSANQAAAIAKVKDWYENRTKDQQVFRVFGYAGAGKTTIVRHAIQELGLETMVRNPDGTASGSGVLYGAFTGKAALVMSRKGTPASTIHSLIYRVSEATEAEIEKVKQEIAEIRAKLPGRAAAERLLEESRMRSLELRLQDAHKPRFVLNDQSYQRALMLTHQGRAHVGARPRGAAGYRRTRHESGLWHAGITGPQRRPDRARRGLDGRRRHG